MLRRTTELTKHVRTEKVKGGKWGFQFSEQRRTHDSIAHRKLSMLLSKSRSFNADNLSCGSLLVLQNSFNGVFLSRCMSTGKTIEVKPSETKPAKSDNKSVDQHLEIDTNKGKLVVKATLNNDSKLQTVIIEKPKVDVASTIDKLKDKSDAEVKRALEEELKIKLDEKPKVAPPPPPKKRSKLDPSHLSLERNFITPVRAMSDFLLKPADLESLPKTKRRSPYEQEPPITVYWRKDVEAKAIEVWGTRENLLKECLKREIEKKKHQQNIFTVKRRLRDYRREIGSKTKEIDEETGLFGGSGKVVLTAIGM